MRVPLILAGGVLLLPGLCAAWLTLATIIEFVSDPGGTLASLLDSASLALAVLWAFCFLMAWAGYRLIRRALR